VEFSHKNFAFNTLFFFFWSVFNTPSGRKSKWDNSTTFFSLWTFELSSQDFQPNSRAFLQARSLRKGQAGPRSGWRTKISTVHRTAVSFSLLPLPYKGSLKRYDEVIHCCRAIETTGRKIAFKTFVLTNIIKHHRHLSSMLRPYSEKCPFKSSQ